MKIAHIYARYSTGTQAKGTSLRRQISNAEAFAAEQGWTIADIIADKGVSAYRGKNLAQGGLGRFFNAVKTGKVAPGSVLIVESLDRLSRNTVSAQMSLLLDIIRAGVEVVTLVDHKHFTCATVNSNPLEIIVSLAIMIRAQDESRTKGGRIAAAWSMKRSRLETHKLTRRCPPWLTLSQDRSRFLINDCRASAAQTIFRLATLGYAPQMIVDHLNQANTSAWGKDTTWTVTKILDVLKNRAAIGEFQPHKMEEGKRVPAGDARPDYFPAIVSLETFHAANRSSTVLRGPLYGDSNLFIGLAWDGETKEKMVLRNNFLVNASCYYGGVRHRWAYRAFEGSLLAHLAHIDWDTLLAEPSEDGRASARLSLEANIREIELKLLMAANTILTQADASAQVAVEIKSLEACRERLQKELTDLESGNIPPVAGHAEASKDRSTFIKLVRNGDTASRLRLRHELHRLIKRIELWPEPHTATGIRLYSQLLHRAVETAGLKWENDPSGWPCYKITFVNGQECWVICQYACPPRRNGRKPWRANTEGVMIWLRNSG